MRAAIYTRISRDREGAGLGVDRQEADCRELAERLGWEVVATYSDNDVSAYSGRARPGYRKMLSDIEAGVVDGVVAWHADRLHRRVTELEEFVGICERHGTAVQTVRSGSVDLSSASGRMVARMLGAAAQHEVDHARERMKRAKAQAAADGRYRGGPRPFGYERDGVTVKADEANLVAGASQAVLDGRSLASIARDWNASGSTGTRGQQWNGSRVKKVLIRPRNAGLLSVADEVAGTAEWPAIVSEDVWRAVTSILTDARRRTNAGRSNAKWLGSGIYRCGSCGKKMRATKSNGRTVYRCEAGTHVSRVQAVVDEYVENHIRAYLARADVRDAFAASNSQSTSVEVDRIAGLRARLTGFEVDYAEGHLSGRQLREASERVRAQIQELEAAIAAKRRGDALSAIGGSPDPASAYDAATLDVKRAVLAELLEVVVYPGSKGRPKGWRPGEPYSDVTSIDVARRERERG
ncbi:MULTISPECIES: recombinase family protein [unclassified Aeromicrobium]|uniref:recombinase family protein n=1 Tax=unclassified Aeromicrobium TaxID=2633570 RepID=UPI00396B0D7D